MRKFLLVCLIMTTLLLLTVPYGFAYMDHPNGTEDRTGYDKKMSGPNSKGCNGCHAYQTEHTAGPHGGYTATTDKCTACHTIHNAENEALLPGTTVTGTCNFCHDLTQSEFAPFYYLSYLTTDSKIMSAHEVDGIDLPLARDQWPQMPGGDVFGGGANLDTSNQGKLSGDKFTCNSCHTPHAIKGTTVDPYLGESKMKFEVVSGNKGRFWLTDRLLKQRLNGSDFIYGKYDSDWCAGCHKGRYKNNNVHNHPVAMTSQGAGNKAMGYQYLYYLPDSDIIGYTKESLIEKARDGRDNGTYPTFFWSTEDADTVTVGLLSGDRVLKKDPRTNRQFAMIKQDPLSGTNRPDVPEDDYSTYTNIGPSCQQCHGNARDVETAFSAGLNNLRTTFPHTGKNRSLVVEPGDDFCTNCHGLDDLP